VAILVTGGTGFVGSNVVKALAARGQEVITLARRRPAPERFDAFLGPLGERVRSVAGDILDRPRIREVVEAHAVRAVVHAAVFNPSEYGPGVAAEQARVNVEGTLSVAEAARLGGAARVVYVSSAMVYGPCDPERPVAEDRPPNPSGLYGASKYAGELVLRAYAAAAGLEAAAVRISLPYGPMERPTRSRPGTSLIYRAVRAGLAGEELAVARDPSCRDFTHVADTAAGIAAITLHDRLAHGLYNVAGGRPYRVPEALEAIAGLVPGFRFRWLDGGSVPEPRGPLDIGRAREEVGFAPRHDLRRGLAAYLDWLRAGAGLALAGDHLG
jgi:nucleoside-diphosphate-sugar epimerase